MGCDYYIQNELVIEYIDIIGRPSSIRTNRDTIKGYIFSYTDYDSDDDKETSYKKYKSEIEKKIKENTYIKTLFENDTWIKESYRKNYEEQLKREFKEIHKFKNIYKKVSAWERN
jgi:hypothetical protein